MRGRIALLPVRSGPKKHAVTNKNNAQQRYVVMSFSRTPLQRLFGVCRSPYQALPSRTAAQALDFMYSPMYKARNNAEISPYAARSHGQPQVYMHSPRSEAAPHGLGATISGTSFMCTASLTASKRDGEGLCFQERAVACPAISLGTEMKGAMSSNLRSTATGT